MACAVTIDLRRLLDGLIALLLSILVGLSAVVAVGLPAAASEAFAQSGGPRIPRLGMKGPTSPRYRVEMAAIA